MREGARRGTQRLTVLEENAPQKKRRLPNQKKKEKKKDLHYNKTFNTPGQQKVAS
jgi:hypothetical protein